MRAALIFALVMFCTASLAIAQTGPKQKEKPKKKKAPVEKVEKKADAPKPEAPPQVKPAETKAPPAESKSELAATPPKMPLSDEAPSAGPLRRSLFTTGIQDREPVDRVDSLSTTTRQVYFFMDIVGHQGQVITHRWMYNDVVKSEVPIKIGASRWRAYSSKKLLPGWTGEWTVEVVDSSGTVLGVRQFIYH
jgi:hypothetical protein